MEGPPVSCYIWYEAGWNKRRAHNRGGGGAHMANAQASSHSHRLREGLRLAVRIGVLAEGCASSGASTCGIAQAAARPIEEIMGERGC